MTTLKQIKAGLRQALEDRVRRLDHVKEIQRLVWDAKNLETEPLVEGMLRDLAYDLDFYRPDREAGQDPSYFGDFDLERQIRSILERL